jgi:hypothetical protein
MVLIGCILDEIVAVRPLLRVVLTPFASEILAGGVGWRRSGG